MKEDKRLFGNIETVDIYPFDGPFSRRISVVTEPGYVPVINIDGCNWTPEQVEKYIAGLQRAIELAKK